MESRTEAPGVSQPSLPERLFVAGEPQWYLSSAAICVGLGVMGLAAAAGAAHASDLVDSAPLYHPVSADISQLAAEEDFWVNISKYFRFFISLMTGTAYVLLRPFARMLKNPVTAVLLVAGIVGGIFFLNFTLNAMLGLSDPVDYKFSPIN